MAKSLLLVRQIEEQVLRAPTDEERVFIGALSAVDEHLLLCTDFNNHCVKLLHVSTKATVTIEGQSIDVTRAKESPRAAKVVFKEQEDDWRINCVRQMTDKCGELLFVVEHNWISQPRICIARKQTNGEFLTVQTIALDDEPNFVHPCPTTPSPTCPYARFV